jgi:hypothetical protein
MEVSAKLHIPTAFTPTEDSPATQLVSDWWDSGIILQFSDEKNIRKLSFQE